MNWRRRLRSVYWLGCGFCALVGVAGVGLILFVPVEMLDENGQVLGEMPPAFGAALFFAVVGAVGLAAGVVVEIVLRQIRLLRTKRL